MASLTVFDSLNLAFQSVAQERLLKLNGVLRDYGLELTPEATAEILDARERILKNQGRVELDLSVTEKLIAGLAGSAFMMQEELTKTINDAFEVFHFLKNALSDFIGDDEVIDAMLTCFDQDCGGSSELLLGKGAEKILKSFARRPPCRNLGMDEEE
ncbi:MAG TPA: hypothetical protein DIT32_08750 [Peptococcaceae bacterium]|nr:hypothetical protein [Peptococcaceae bacterium]